MTEIEIDLSKLERGTHVGQVKVTRGGKTFYRKQRVGRKEFETGKVDNKLVKEIESIPHGKIKEINGHDVKHGYKYAQGYEVDDEWLIIERFGSSEKRNIFPNSETLALFVDGKIRGLRFDPPESTNKSIPIVELSESGYQGQDMAWREEQTNTYITKKETVGYHYSTSKIKKFGMKEIAMAGEGYHRNFTPEFGYKIIIPKGTTIKEFGSSEIRANLTKEMKVYPLKSGWCKYTTVSR